MIIFSLSSITASFKMSTDGSSIRPEVDRRWCEFYAKKIQNHEREDSSFLRKMPWKGKHSSLKGPDPPTAHNSQIRYVYRILGWMAKCLFSKIQETLKSKHLRRETRIIMRNSTGKSFQKLLPGKQVNSIYKKIIFFMRTR